MKNPSEKQDQPKNFFEVVQKARSTQVATKSNEDDPFSFDDKPVPKA